jgi:replicative DNA helicase Mcm
MSCKRNNENIDLNLYPDLADVVEKVYIDDKNLYIKLKKPKEDFIIATIKDDYTLFRKEIERLLKEKRVDKEDTINILAIIDISHEIIYKDDTIIRSDEEYNDSNTKDTNSLKTDLSDPPDLSDTKDIQIVNVSQCLKLHSGKVQLTGNIVGISDPIKLVHKIGYSCACDGERGNTKSFDPPVFALPKERQCKKCNRFFKIDKNSIGYKNAITIQIQDNEKFSDVEKIRCILLDIDIDKIKIGEKVNVTGNIHILSKFNKNFLAPIVFADKLEYENKDEIITNENDIKAIERFAKQKGSRVIETLVDMFDKSIIGNNIAKEALLYGLVSAGNDLEDIRKFKRRKRINVLIAGDPGAGKSSLLKKAVTLSKNSRYESVQHSSAKSLTAIVLKEDEQHFLRLGPIPTAKGSICALNEIGTMGPDDQNHLLDIMEEGEFTVNKFGHNSKILSPTTIIASSNLKANDEYDFEYGSNILPLENQLLDRFDLIVILKDKGDMKALEEYTEKKTELLFNKEIPKYDPFLQKYLEYARKKPEPIFSQEALKMIQRYYFDLNKSNLSIIKSKRKLEIIFRLCKAVSRLKLKDTVDADDVIYATKFYNAIIYNYIGFKATIPKDPVKLIIEESIAILKDNMGNPISFNDLIKQICFENEYIKSYLLGSNCKKTNEEIDILLRIDRNKKVRRIKNILCNDKNIAIINKNPIILQHKEDVNISSGSEGSEGSDKAEANEIESLTLKQSMSN